MKIWQRTSTLGHEMRGMHKGRAWHSSFYYTSNTITLSWEWQTTPSNWAQKREIKQLMQLSPHHTLRWERNRSLQPRRVAVSTRHISGKFTRTLSPSSCQCLALRWILLVFGLHKSCKFCIRLILVILNTGPHTLLWQEWAENWISPICILYADWKKEFVWFTNSISGEQWGWSNDNFSH